MLRLPPFEYLVPRQLEEALEQLASHQDEAMIVAGGTDLLPGMKRGIFKPGKLISLQGLTDLKRISRNEDGISIGAGVTLSQIAENHELQLLFPALTSAAGTVATPQLRNAGTVGGNLCLDTRCTYYNQSEQWREALGYCLKKDGQICWVATSSKKCLAVHSSDTAPVMISLDARVRLIGPSGERWLPVEQLYRTDGIDYLRKRRDEILSEVFIPAGKDYPAHRQGTSFLKLRRRGSFDFSTLNVAVSLRLNQSGKCLDARIVLGAIASAPARSTAAESFLVGTRIETGVIDEAARLACRPLKPLDNTDMSTVYRRKMARVYVTRALEEAVIKSGLSSLEKRI